MAGVKQNAETHSAERQCAGRRCSAMHLDPQIEEVLGRLGPGSTDAHALTAAAVREDDRHLVELQRKSQPVHAVADVTISDSAGMRARIYRPAPGTLPTLVYFHGGGFVIGPDGYDEPMRQLALATGCRVVAPRVRLAPEHPFPAPLEDAIAAARAIVERAVEPCSARPIGVAGDSSGGNLAARVARELTREGVAVDLQVLIYPMLDATASSPSYAQFGDGFGFTRAKSLWYFEQYLPAGTNRRDPRVSPVFDVDLSGLPSTMILTAECDPLRDEGEEYARRIEMAGGNAVTRRYPGMIHGFFQMTAAVDAALAAQRDIADWIHDQFVTSHGPLVA
jgi:acetyl esterase